MTHLVSSICKTKIRWNSYIALPLILHARTYFEHQIIAISIQIKQHEIFIFSIFQMSPRNQCQMSEYIILPLVLS